MRKFDQQLLRLKSMLGVTSDQDVAALLGLSKAAFSDRKRRDAFPEDKLLALVATRTDLAIDPQYVLTGVAAKDRFITERGLSPRDYLELTEWAMERSENTAETSAGSPPKLPTLADLPPDEQLLLEAYRGLTAAARKALLAELLTGGKRAPARRKPVSEDAGIKVSGSGHRVAGRDYHE
jgi:hypothetical protein